MKLCALSTVPARQRLHNKKGTLEELANTTQWVVLTSAAASNRTPAHSFPSHLFPPISGILDHAPHSVRGF